MSSEQSAENTTRVEIEDEFVQEHAVPAEDAKSFVHIGLDSYYHPTGGYWAPVDLSVGEVSVVGRKDVPSGELIQYPCEDREPEIVAQDQLPDWVENRVLPSEVDA